MKTNKLFKFILAIMFMFYAAWELYWYSKVGIHFIKWHTHLFFVFVVYFLSLGALKLFKVSKKIVFIHFMIFIGLFITEAILMFSGINKTPTEKYFGFYSDGYLDLKQRYYWIDKRYSVKVLQSEEFYFERKMNSLGYSDYEWNIEKDSNEFRILCLGDSFTDGDGAHADSSYVAFLRRLFKIEYPQKKISILNAGKCGSDPFFNFVNYRDRLYKFKPDIILQTISSQDIIEDIQNRGGFERFNQLELTRINQLNQFIYAVSYISRPFFDLFKRGNSKSIMNKSIIIEKLEELFHIYSNLARKNNTELIVIALPTKTEFNNEQYFPVMRSILKEINFDEMIDLLRCYLDYSKANSKLFSEYYWIIDGHHNAKGYELMAYCIFESLKNGDFFRFNLKY